MSIKTERLDFRIAEKQKELIESAALLLGESVSSFAVSTLLERASEVVATYQHTQLTRDDAKRFLAIIDSNDEPNAKLKAAFKKHQQHYG